MISQGVRVYEVVFWDPTANKQLARTSRAPSCPEFIDVVDNYTLLLHQGLIEHSFLDEIESVSTPSTLFALSLLISRSSLLTSASVRSAVVDYQPTNSFQQLKAESFDRTNSSPARRSRTPPNTSTTPSRRRLLTPTRRRNSPFGLNIYSVAMERGAWSVRRLLGVVREMGNERVGLGWRGVRLILFGGYSMREWRVRLSSRPNLVDIDVVLPIANFPDIQFKCMIHSKDAGSIMVIPRENGLCRFYVQLQKSEDGSSSHFGQSANHLSRRTPLMSCESTERSAATQEICIERAKKIFAPFKLEFGYVDWFSVYQIGQRIASAYTLDHRIILGGDATHTHSPSAGQGYVSPLLFLSVVHC